MTDKKHNSKKQINRREMLKKGALAAGGAITAAAFLDGKWLKPIVKTGILPVHAQASICGVYTFTPRFEYNEQQGGGSAWNLGVYVAPIGPDGPISYEIMGFTGITITPGVGSSGSGTLTGGDTNFSEVYNFGQENSQATVTIKWSYDGCDYTQTYGAEVIDVPF